jgi:hypothetical protein
LEHLPAPGDYWSKEDRSLWLRMVELSFDLIYSDEPDDADRNVGEQQHTGA